MMKKSLLITSIIFLSFSAAFAQQKPAKKNPPAKNSKSSVTAAKKETVKPSARIAEYDDIRSFSDGGYAVTESGGKYGMIDSKGNEILPCKYDNYYSLAFQDGMTLISVNGKKGFADKQGREVVPPVYDDADKFRDGYAKVCLNGKWGIIDKTGKLTVPAVYKNIHDTGQWDFVPAQDGSWGYISPKGDTVIPFAYQNAYGFYHGLALVRLENAFSDPQVIDKKGNVIIPAGKYDDISGFYYGYATVKKDGKYGIIDTAGSQMVSIMYDFVGYFTEGAVPVNIKDGWGFLDMDGRFIAQCYYKDVRNFREGYAAVHRHSGSYSFIDKAGREITSKQYESCLDFSEKFAVVKSNGKYGFIDTTGSEIIPVLYDEAESFSNGLARVRLGADYYFINKDGSRNFSFIVRKKAPVPAAEIASAQTQNSSYSQSSVNSNNEAPRLAGKYFYTSLVTDGRYAAKENIAESFVIVRALNDNQVRITNLEGDEVGVFSVTKIDNDNYDLSDGLVKGKVVFKAVRHSQYMTSILKQVTITAPTQNGGQMILEASEK
ncbi:MAG: WG repeat-containing protein [Bacteroidota bacterium]